MLYTLFTLNVNIVLRQSYGNSAGGVLELELLCGEKRTFSARIRVVLLDAENRRQMPEGRGSGDWMKKAKDQRHKLAVTE